MKLPFSFSAISPETRPYMVGSLLVFLCAIVWMWLIFGLKSSKPIVLNESDAPTMATSTTSTVASMLDGESREASEALRAPFAVMIDNQVDARPWAGVEQASVVIEAPVEGGITRFLAFFSATSSYDRIGPIRSARPYFVDWAEAWQSMYFHVGGSQEALEKLKTAALTDVSEMAYGSYFWRDSQYFAPHNTFTKGSLMEALAIRKSVTSTVFTHDIWTFEDVTTSSKPRTQTVQVPYEKPYAVEWQFDETVHGYARRQNGRIQKTQAGNSVVTQNVIILHTDVRVLDAIGRLEVRTVGSGDAVVYREGREERVRWRRGKGEPIRFETMDGREVALTRGKTWIQVVMP